MCSAGTRLRGGIPCEIHHLRKRLQALREWGYHLAHEVLFLVRETRTEMRPSSIAALAGLLIVSLPAVCARATADSQQNQPKSKAKAGDSLTGCVDEENGRYVLTDDREMKPIADLVADGFPTEGFAKHVGHKVTVRGISTPGEGRPVFKVRTIETVSETCTPRPPLQLQGVP